MTSQSPPVPPPPDHPRGAVLAGLCLALIPLLL